MKTILYTSIWLLWISGVYAQPSAQDILAKVSHIYQQDKSLQADFTFSVIQQGKTLGPAQKGTLKVQGEKYRVDMQDRIFISDGQDQWTVLREVKEVQITPVDKSNGGLNPTNIFDFYKNGYLTKTLEDTQVKGVSCYAIQLNPSRKDQGIQKIRMHVRKDNHRIQDIRVWQDNGDELYYGIEKQVTNLDIPAKHFVFQASAYPDMELVDLR